MSANYQWLAVLVVVIAGSGISDGNTYDIYHATTEETPPHRGYDPSMLCMDLNTQRTVNVEQMLGKWYGVEIIMHSEALPGEFVYDSCVVVHLSDFTNQMPARVPYYESTYNYNRNNNNNNFNNNNNNNNNNNYFRQTPQYSSVGVTDHYHNSPQQQAPQTPPQMHYNNHQQHMGLHSVFDSSNNNNNNDDSFNFNNGNYNDRLNNFDYMTKYLQLVWVENESKKLEYILNYTDSNAGVWNNVEPQRGSLVVPNQYTQFTGRIQVVKAVQDHCVLTFCSNNVKSSIYTLVLSRSLGGLSEHTKLSIRNMLQSRGLSTQSRRKVCTSHAPKDKALSCLLILLMIFVPVFGKFL